MIAGVTNGPQIQWFNLIRIVFSLKQQFGTLLFVWLGERVSYVVTLCLRLTVFISTANWQKQVEQWMVAHVRSLELGP